MFVSPDPVADQENDFAMKITGMDSPVMTDVGCEQKSSPIPDPTVLKKRKRDLESQEKQNMSM